jgi:hypothetical protein
MTSGQQLLLTITMYLNSQKHAYNSKASSRSVVLPTARKRAWQPVDALDELAVCFVGLPAAGARANDWPKAYDSASLAGRSHRNRTSTDMSALRARPSCDGQEIDYIVTEHPFRVAVTEKYCA